jgi:hypothetical protein
MAETPDAARATPKRNQEFALSVEMEGTFADFADMTHRILAKRLPGE